MAFRRKKISQGRTVGSRLRCARKKQKITLEQAEEETKIRIKYLQAIEADNWHLFPNRVYVLGFIRRYARFVGLDEEKILKEFKREFGEFKLLAKRSRQPRLVDQIIITPKLLLVTISTIAVIALVGYIIFSARSISKPPTIEILAPVSETLQQKEIKIEGKTNPTAVVEINNQLVSVDNNGYFSQRVVLTAGVNNFNIVAKNRLGRQSQKELKLFYSPKAGN